MILYSHYSRYNPLYLYLCFGPLCRWKLVQQKGFRTGTSSANMARWEIPDKNGGIIYIYIYNIMEWKNMGEKTN